MDHSPIRYAALSRSSQSPGAGDIRAMPLSSQVSPHGRRRFSAVSVRGGRTPGIRSGHATGSRAESRVCERQRLERPLACLVPQRFAPPQTVTESHGLQRVLHARTHSHALMAVPHQRAQISLFSRRDPDRGEAIFRQQLQQQTCIPPIVFLLTRSESPDLCWMAHSAVDLELSHSFRNHGIDR